MADWHWECDPDDLLDGLAPTALDHVESLAREITVRDSVVFIDSTSYTGIGPGLRTESRGRLMLDVRGERIVVVQVSWFE